MNRDVTTHVPATKKSTLLSLVLLVTALISILAPTPSAANERLCRTAVEGKKAAPTNLPSPVFKKLSSVDVELVWSVFSDPVVRAQSHDEFKKKKFDQWLNDEKQSYYAILVEGELAGIAQFYLYPSVVQELEKVKALIPANSSHKEVAGLGIHLLPKFFGRGLAKPTVQFLKEEAFKNDSVGLLWAGVQKDNASSNGLFTKLFGEPVVKVGEYNDYNYYFMTREKP